MVGVDRVNSCYTRNWLAGRPAGRSHDLLVERKCFPSFCDLSFGVSDPSSVPILFLSERTVYVIITSSPGALSRAQWAKRVCDHCEGIEALLRKLGCTVGNAL